MCLESVHIIISHNVYNKNRTAYILNIRISYHSYFKPFIICGGNLKFILTVNIHFSLKKEGKVEEVT
jgi:hypothetical protein